MQAIQAQIEDIPQISQLYQQYLTFYKVDFTDRNPQQFLQERLINKESILYYVQDKQGNYLGFAQLYPLFCSLEMKRIWLLYDLFVKPSARKQGVAAILLDRAEQLAKETNSAFVMLSTATDNLSAQRVYEQHGYVHDNEFYTYLHHIE